MAELTTWRPSGRARERILTFGRQGTGKSHNILRLARKLPDVTFWIVDNDNTMERLLETEFEDLGVREEWRWVGDDVNGKFERDGEWETEGGTLVVFHAQGWAANKAALHVSKTRATRDDWLVIDSLTVLWDDVQSWYGQVVWGEEMADHLMELRVMFEQQKEAGKAKKGKENMTAMESMFPEWGFINPEYKTAVTDLLTNPPCHLYATAELAELQGDRDAANKELYGSVQAKPKGQKRSGHSVQTVLMLTKTRAGEYAMTTVKDRGREDMVNEDVGNWEMSYVMRRAGWRPRKVEVD